MNKKLIQSIYFVIALCISVFCEHLNQHHENFFKEMILPENNKQQKSYADSLYSFLNEKYSYRVEKDAKLWNYMSRDYLQCTPPPLPSGYSDKDSIHVVYDYNGVPVARKIFIG